MVEEAYWQECANALIPMLYKMAVGILHNDADAQDAVQTALLKAWAARGRIQPATCRAYIVRILINESRDMLRKRAYSFPTDQVPELTIGEEGEAIRDLVSAIYSLPEKYRLPLYLKYLEGLTEKEAAAALQISCVTFRSRLHRARVALRRTLDGEVDWE